MGHMDSADTVSSEPTKLLPMQTSRSPKVELQSPQASQCSGLSIAIAAGGDCEKLVVTTMGPIIINNNQCHRRIVFMSQTIVIVVNIIVVIHQI